MFFFSRFRSIRVLIFVIFIIFCRWKGLASTVVGSSVVSIALGASATALGALGTLETSTTLRVVSALRDLAVLGTSTTLRAMSAVATSVSLILVLSDLFDLSLAGIKIIGHPCLLINVPSPPWPVTFGEKLIKA